MDQIRQPDNPFFSSLVKVGPISNMLFRPEDVHGASGIGDVVEPLGEWNGYMPYYPLRVGAKENTVSYLHTNWHPAIQTGSIYTDYLSWKKPADCQRLERSLPEPFLRAINRYAILGRKVVKRGK